jgi:membrane glycosyltransferase
VRAADRNGFIDLVPAPQAVTAPRARGWARPQRALRLVSASLMMGVAALAMTVPQSGIAPELSPAIRAETAVLAWRAEQEVVAYWTEPMLPLVGEMPVRKRVLVRDSKPARMIDDALRQRALEAVREMMMTQTPPV